MDESCLLCGWEFRGKGSPLQEHYRPFQDQYLLEKAILKQIWEEKNFSIEEVDTSDEDEGSDLNGYSDERAEVDEQLELDYGPMELEVENMFGNDRVGVEFDERQRHQNGISIGLEEAGIHLEHDFKEDVQASEDRDGEWNWLEKFL